MGLIDGKRVMVGVAVVAVLLGVPGATLAKRQKRTVSATVGGKRVNWKGRLVIIRDTGAAGLTVIATKRFATKTIGVGCGIILTGPVTTTACSLNYMVRQHRQFVGWFNPGLDPMDPVTVTITSFDGTSIQGSFSGTLQPTTPAAGSPLMVQGTFGGPFGP
jgi:hypothetical protein